MRLTKLVFFALFTCVSFVSQAQDDDLLLWSSLKLGYEPNDKWDLSLEGHYRLKDNMSALDSYFGELSVFRTLVKGLKMGVGVRYILENDNQGLQQGTENHFRYNFDLTYQHKINRMALKYRLRYQNKNEFGEPAGREAFRIKAGFRYNLRNWKLDPKFSAELLNRFGDRGQTGNRYRLGIGTEYKLKNAGAIAVFYRIQNDINGEFSSPNHIIGLSYGYTIR